MTSKRHAPHFLFKELPERLQQVLGVTFFAIATLIWLSQLKISLPHWAAICDALIACAAMLAWGIFKTRHLGFWLVAATICAAIVFLPSAARSLSHSEKLIGIVMLLLSALYRVSSDASYRWWNPND